MASLGTRGRMIRVDDELWLAFKRACEDKGTDRSTVLREFMAWYVGTTNKVPTRPDA